MICTGCVADTHGKKLSPHNVLFWASKHVILTKPVKSDVYETLQKYFDGQMG